MPGFPDAERVKPKGGRPRWRLPNGDIIEWDGQHGEVERYDPRGKHKGAWSPDGEKIKDADKKRRIDPAVGGMAMAATAIIVYEVLKGVVAIAGAPETAGASLGLLVVP